VARIQDLAIPFGIERAVLGFTWREDRTLGAMRHAYGADNHVRAPSVLGFCCVLFRTLFRIRLGQAALNADQGGVRRMNNADDPSGGDVVVYRDVRALRRGLEIIEALSRTGWLRPTDLAKITGIDRSTIYRIVNTLEDKGFAARRREDGAIALKFEPSSQASSNFMTQQDY
jgi:hypothetical protein